ncbi:hybrid sensor histidine kinase/response regulator [Massilia sp. TWP1-3-3]|uniref:hybrid sensor histidine kinase/response regulator n=1 Tax=Massilia sp. TWP1-3-3 TaxID=2804573 RepID=UPI003CE7206C
MRGTVAIFVVSSSLGVRNGAAYESLIMVDQDHIFGVAGTREEVDAGQAAPGSRLSVEPAGADCPARKNHLSYPAPQPAQWEQASGAQEDVALAGLADEVARLRAVEAERDALLEHNRLLCGVNQNLVLATFEAQSLREEAEAANTRQNKFLAMLAHELRNPLAPISMAGAILGKIAAPSAQLLSVQKTIERQVSHLSRLLDDLLDAARINSGKITLACSPILLAEQLSSAVETVQLRINERSQQLELHVPSDDIVLYGDPVRLAQVFSNLLVNASKFTQDGGTIVVRAWVQGATVKISIADNGAGISPEIISSIFGLFTQGPRSLARSEGGLGVGLNVVQNVVAMHGGTVQATSAGLGHGSVFTLCFPLPAGSTHRHNVPASGPDDGQHSHRILLVEDNVDASQMLAMLLRAVGYTVETAFDGPGGLARASAEYFDVLICDIGLPGFDGYSLMRALRAQLDKKAPYAIAVSGYGKVEDKAQAMEAGFAQYLIKPVNIDALLALIASVPSRRVLNRQ